MRTQTGVLVAQKNCRAKIERIGDLGARGFTLTPTFSKRLLRKRNGFKKKHLTTSPSQVPNHYVNASTTTTTSTYNQPSSTSSCTAELNSDSMSHTELATRMSL